MVGKVDSSKRARESIGSRVKRAQRARASAVGGLTAYLLAAVTAMAVSAQDLVPVRSEFQVNTVTTMNQWAPAVAAAADGGTVIVWSDDGSLDGDSSSIRGQLYETNGSVLGSAFQVNMYTTGQQSYGQVARAATGEFVVVWVDGRNSTDVFGQRFDPAGGSLGAELHINTFTPGQQEQPVAAMGPNGDFVVAFTDLNGRDGSGHGVFRRLYDSNGNSVGDQLQVNEMFIGTQSRPSLDMGVDGRSVVVWSSEFVDGDFQSIMARQYDADGGPDGGEFQVNTYTTSRQVRPDVALAADGGFVVVWASESQDGSGYGVYGQRHDSGGSKVGSEFQVNTYTTGDQTHPTVAFDDAGTFVVAWDGFGASDSSAYGVFAQHFDASGSRLGQEFRVNSHTANGQHSPKITAVEDTLAFAWTSVDQDGDRSGVFGQRFCRDRDADGSCDSVDLCFGNNGLGDADGDGLCLDRDCDDEDPAVGDSGAACELFADGFESGDVAAW